MEKRNTAVHNAASHSVKLQIWRLTCSPTLERRSTCVHNATIQLIELLLFDATLCWSMLGESLNNATSEIILQSIYQAWQNNPLRQTKNLWFTKYVTLVLHSFQGSADPKRSFAKSSGLNGNTLDCIANIFMSVMFFKFCLSLFLGCSNAISPHLLIGWTL